MNITRVKLTNKLPAGTLVITIVVALIFSILCGYIVLVGYYNRGGRQKNDIAQKLIRNEESAINLVLSDTAFYISKEASIDLFSGDKDSANIKQGAWGIFRYASVKISEKRFSRKKNFIYGADLPGYMDACLYLANHRRSLVLVGKTKLTGNVYLSPAGVKAGNIGQGDYENAQLIKGKINNSEENLPNLDSSILHYLFRLHDNIRHSYWPGDNFNLVENTDYSRSFSDSTLSYYQQDKLLLENITLDGRIMICSDSEIEVAESAKLKNVILVAPSIRFRSNFKGTVQAIASDSLVAGPGCVFNYPSALILLKNNYKKDQPVLAVAGNCMISGIIIAHANNDDIYKTHVDLGYNTVVKGVVYAKGYLSLKGYVDGVVLTDYFIHRSPAAVYENYLVDVIINRNKLSAYFTGSPIFNNSKTQKVIEWVE